MIRYLTVVLALLGAIPVHLPAAAARDPGRPDSKQVAQQRAVDQVFDLSRLHVIDLVAAPWPENGARADPQIAAWLNRVRLDPRADALPGAPDDEL